MSDSDLQFTPSLTQITEWLAGSFDDVDEVTLLQRDGWSSAFSFRSRERDLVLRLGPHRQDFEKERIAATWQAPGVPPTPMSNDFLRTITLWVQPLSIDRNRSST